MKIYNFREANKWEREVWHHFVRMTDEQAEIVRRMIANDNSYSLKEAELTEEEVAERVKYSLCRGYMPCWNDAGTLSVIPKPEDENYPADAFYKGRIARYCTPSEKP